MKRLWLITELFHPDEISTGYVMTRLAERLADDFEMGVICGPVQKDNMLKSDAKLDHRIRVLRTGFQITGSKSLPVRIANNLILCMAFFVKVLIHVRKKDKVVMVTNPPVLVPVLFLLKKIMRFEWNIIVHDLFPDNAIAVGLIKKDTFISKILLKLYTNAYQSADKIVAVGDDMLNVLNEKLKEPVPIKVITNWSDHDQIYPIDGQDISEYYDMDLSNQVVLQFAGNLGRVQGLDRFFDLLGNVRNQHFSLMMIGSGAYKSVLQQKKADYSLAQVHFMGEKPRNEQLFFLNACHISIITLHEQMYGLGVPSKVYNVLAAGKPILYLGDPASEIHNYIVKYEIGWTFSWDQKDEIIHFLESLGPKMAQDLSIKGKNARKLAEEKFNKSQILNSYSDYLQN